jgi:D-alanyl-D-alanine carboxypeptidase/D-alanyl-D-alanine-endopeptidase (penicillin-binding protein 4)
MINFRRTGTLGLVIAAVLGVAMPAAAQTSRPFLQDIQVHRETVQPSATPFVQKTSSIDEVKPAAVSYSPINTTIPLFQNISVPGYSGIIVEKLNGERVIETGSTLTYNPASNVKIATSYAVLKTFGPEYRFATSVWTDGSYDPETKTIHGNLYVSGRDPVFRYEHAMALANELNRMGIRSVQGDLVVTDNFAMNYNTVSARAGQTLFKTLDAANRPTTAVHDWKSYLINSGRLDAVPELPSVTFTGSVYVQSMPSNAKLLFSHESAPMREIVKAMMCYSNNFLAERLGDMVGGPFAVARIAQQDTGSLPNEFYLATASGLGINRVTPTAMMKLLRALRNELARNRMTFADIMPVAGIDKGTLENRFDTDFAMGSVVGKTGTLGNTDGGVSALAGEMNTRNGRLLFVIFNQRGSVSRFRSFQNNYISTIQGQFGGAAPFTYSATSLDYRLSKTRIAYPATGRMGGIE